MSISTSNRLNSRLNSNEDGENTDAADNTLCRLLDGISEISNRGNRNHVEMGGTNDLFIEDSPQKLRTNFELENHRIE